MPKAKPTTEERRVTFDQKAQERLASLVKLANDDDESEESRNAAIQVTRMMKDHKLVLVPQEQIDKVKKLVDGAEQLAKTHASQRNQDRIFGGILGILLAKQLKI